MMTALFTTWPEASIRRPALIAFVATGAGGAASNTANEAAIADEAANRIPPAHPAPPGLLARIHRPRFLELFRDLFRQRFRRHDARKVAEAQDPALERA